MSFYQQQILRATFLLDKIPRFSKKDIENNPSFKSHIYNALYQNEWIANHPGLMIMAFLLRIFTNLYTILTTALIIYVIYRKCRKYRKPKKNNKKNEEEIPV